MRLLSVAVLLVALAAGAALFAFPIYYWIQDRRRRGEPVTTVGLLGVAILEVLTLAAMWLFASNRFRI